MVFERKVIDDGSHKSAIEKGTIRYGSNPTKLPTKTPVTTKKKSELDAQKEAELLRQRRIEELKREIGETKEKMEEYNTAINGITDAISALRSAEGELQSATDSLLEACSGARVDTINSSINSSIGSTEDVASVLNAYRAKAREKYKLLERALEVLERNLLFI